MKATNVLLDKNINSKINDFGLAKLDKEDDTHISIRVAGTYFSHAWLAKRASLILRLTSPQSLVANASAFESFKGSDEDVDVIENENANLDVGYLHTNGNVVKF
ncbi:probable leucine-rich repeat receptor-like serine/threonine-protein kinase [Tanacetum coccineum]